MPPTSADYRFDHTVDHIMVKPKVKQLKSKVTGADPTVVTPEQPGVVGPRRPLEQAQARAKPKKK